MKHNLDKESATGPIAPPSLSDLPEWVQFEQAARAARIDPSRLRVINAAGIDLDTSGQHASAELTDAAEALLAARNFDETRKQLLEGGIVNLTEERAAWHSALRAPATVPEVAAERQRLIEFIHTADSERRWRNIVHIGIGGSDWGVRLAVAAFGYAGTWRQVHFVANIDGHAIQGGLSGFDPHDTLIVMASKSFTTAETLENGKRALEWLQAAGVADPYNQMIAITARPDTAREWGIPNANIFRIWDWVGGRFSLWSAVSLTTALAVSADVIAGMQAGAAAMDKHFAETPIHENAPVQMALAGIVNRSILGYGSLNIAPYDFRLANLVPYIQQLEMESLGKSEYRRQAGQRADRPRCVGHARHRRSAHLLSVAAPGQRRRPRGFHHLRPCRPWLAAASPHSACALPCSAPGAAARQVVRRSPERMPGRRHVAATRRMAGAPPPAWWRAPFQSDHSSAAFPLHAGCVARAV